MKDLWHFSGFNISGKFTSLSEAKEQVFVMSQVMNIWSLKHRTFWYHRGDLLCKNYEKCVYVHVHVLVQQQQQQHGLHVGMMAVCTVSLCACMQYPSFQFSLLTPETWTGGMQKQNTLHWASEPQWGMDAEGHQALKATSHAQIKCYFPPVPLLWRLVSLPGEPMQFPESSFCILKLGKNQAGVHRTFMYTGYIHLSFSCAVLPMPHGHINWLCT